MGTPTLSLVVCTYCRPGPVWRLLDAVAKQSYVPDETLIVDSSPDQETAETVKAFQRKKGLQGLRYLAVPPEQRGLTRQRNFGIERCTGSVVAFLDDDTVPETGYFREVLSCLDRHPEAVGVGGQITGMEWTRVGGGGSPSLDVFEFEGWQRREDYRWRLRKLLGLASPLPPGWIPKFYHGRPASFPPDGRDYQVEFVMGGASAWRSEVFEKCRFSDCFVGYGLYEDMDFCIRATRIGSLYVCTRARVAHYHAPSGRPNHFRYGCMVVRNGWFVWRRRKPACPMSPQSLTPAPIPLSAAQSPGR